MLPNINSKKCRGPEQLIPFPWEKQNVQRKFNKEVEEMTQKLKELGIIDEPEVKKDPE